MTTGTTLTAFKVAYVALLAARPGLAGVQVAYAKPTTELQSEAIWLASATTEDVRLATMGGAVKKVDETYLLSGVVQVLLSDGRDEQTADARANVLLGEVQEALAANPKDLAGVRLATLSGWEHDVGPIGEGTSKGARFDFTIRVEARLPSS